jgi:ubiquinol-cytochrome c reductase cytochrome b subunit
MIPSFFGTAIWGVIGMFGSILMLALLPWIDRGEVRSVRFRGMGYRIALGVLVVSFLSLGAVGAGVTAELIPEWFPSADVTTWENAFGRLMTLGYFGFFIFLWVYTHFGFEKTKPVPERVTMHD